MLSRRNCSPDPSRELVEQVAQQLATRAVRDTDLQLVHVVGDGDQIAIVQNGLNKRVSFETLVSYLYMWLDFDSIKEKLDSVKGIYYNTTDYWNHRLGFVPEAGELVIYADYAQIEIDGRVVNVPGIKIGSGNGFVQDLAFLGEDQEQRLLAHMADKNVHTNPEEKAFWNNKLNVNDAQEVVGESLVFNRN